MWVSQGEIEKDNLTNIRAQYLDLEKAMFWKELTT